jgi:predicted dehydrogenase
LIGFGVGKLYAAALRDLHAYYPDLPDVDLAVVATAGEASGELAIRQFGFERRTTDYREVLTSPDVDLVIIASPPALHREMLLAALGTTKAIYVDKPLARNLGESRDILTAARRAGRDAQMIFEFRFCPALRRARGSLAEGRLGDIRTFRGVYFRSRYVDPRQPLRWKGSLAASGGGVANDIAPHAIDLISWLVGHPTRLMAQARTFIHERPGPSGAPVAVDTDDHVWILAELEGGAVGTFEAGRLVPGSVHDLSIEVVGSRGSLRWSLMNPNYLSLAEADGKEAWAAWRQVPTLQEYPDAAIPPSDLPVGMMRFHLASLADFVRRTLEGRQYDPGLEQGLRVQAVVEAALASARERRWVDVAAE